MNEYLFSDIFIGLSQSFNVTIDEAKLNSFLEISGDNNPLQCDANYAASKGFSGRVVYGMLTSSFYSTLVGVYLPGKYAILHGIDIQFLKPVFLGDNLMVSGTVSYINKAYQQIEVKGMIKKQDGTKISRAVLKIGLIDG